MSSVSACCVLPGDAVHAPHVAFVSLPTAVHQGQHDEHREGDSGDGQHPLEHSLSSSDAGRLPAEPLPTARAQAPPVTLELFPAA